MRDAHNRDCCSAVLLGRAPHRGTGGTPDLPELLRIMWRADGSPELRGVWRRPCQPSAPTLRNVQHSWVTGQHCEEADTGLAAQLNYTGEAGAAVCKITRDETRTPLNTVDRPGALRQEEGGGYRPLQISECRCLYSNTSREGRRTCPVDHAHHAADPAKPLMKGGCNSFSWKKALAGMHCVMHDTGQLESGAPTIGPRGVQRLIHHPHDNAMAARCPGL